MPGKASLTSVTRNSDAQSGNRASSAGAETRQKSRSMSVANRIRLTQMQDTKQKGEKSMGLTSSTTSMSLYDPSRFTNQAFVACATLPAVTKLNAGLFDKVTIFDVNELFAILDQDKNGVLDFQEISAFLREVLHPGCTEEEIEIIYGVTDKDQDGRVSAEELHKGLTNGIVKQHLKAKQKEFRSMQNGKSKITRTMALDRMQARVIMEDAFRTLPFTVAQIGVLIALVVLHLKIRDRHEVENALDNWIMDYGNDLDGPFLPADVSDIPGMWDWLQTSGVKAVLGDCRCIAPSGICDPSPTSDADYACTVAARSLLIGDAELRQIREDGSEKTEWLLHSDLAQKHLESAPGEFLQAAMVQLQHLRSTEWVDSSTDEVRLSFSTYSDRAQMFAVTEVQIAIGIHGRVVPGIIAAGVLNDPYRSKALFALDGFFVLLFSMPLMTELKDLIIGIRTAGFKDGCFAYWSWWNSVDWMNITSSVAAIVIWVHCCMAMAASDIDRMLVEGSGDKRILMPKVMDLTVDDLDLVKDALETVIGLFRLLHVMMLVNTVTIMLRFFKAFQANKRLQLMTNTLLKAAPDIFHFAFVFLVIFVGFALTGHILFGGDLVQFCSLTSSINTAFTVLMGDFAWYMDQKDSAGGLRSQMPFWLMAGWFWLFMIFVLLIMLNMLLAIILDHYTELVQLSRSADDVTIWDQAYAYVKNSWKNRKFIPLYNILLQLEDPDNPFHNESYLDAKTLAQNFPNMMKKQADGLLDWLSREAKNVQGSGDDDTDARLNRLEKFLESISEQLHVVSLRVAKLGEQFSDFVKLKQALGADWSPNPNGHRMSDWTNGDTSYGEKKKADQSDLDTLAATLNDQAARQASMMQELSRVADTLAIATANCNKVVMPPGLDAVKQLPAAPREIPPCFSGCQG